MGKKKDVVEEVVDQVEAPAETDTNDAIIESFNASIESGLEEDDVKMAMINAGATFKNVTRLYNEYMILAGLAISTEDRKKIVSDTLTDVDLQSEEGFDAAVAALMANIQGSTDRSAAALIRSFGKANEIEVYAKPKSTGAARNPFVTLFHEALVENPNMTEDELKAIIAGLSEDHQKNPTRWLSQHNNIRKTANAIAAKLAS